MKTDSKEPENFDLVATTTGGMSRKNQDTDSVCPDLSDQRTTNQRIGVTPETPFEELPILMEVKEVAAYWRVNPKTVYDMINRGELRTKPIGPRLRRIPRKYVTLNDTPGSSRRS